MYYIILLFFDSFSAEKLPLLDETFAIDAIGRFVISFASGSVIAVLVLNAKIDAVSFLKIDGKRWSGSTSLKKTQNKHNMIIKIK